MTFIVLGESTPGVVGEWGESAGFCCGCGLAASSCCVSAGACAVTSESAGSAGLVVIACDSDVSSAGDVGEHTSCIWFASSWSVLVNVGNVVLVWSS